MYIMYIHRKERVYIRHSATPRPIIYSDAKQVKALSHQHCICLHHDYYSRSPRVPVRIRAQIEQGTVQNTQRESTSKWNNRTESRKTNRAKK